MAHSGAKATTKPSPRNPYYRKCELTEDSKIQLTQIGGDYIGLTVEGEYHKVGGIAQHIIWELMRRLEL